MWDKITSKTSFAIDFEERFFWIKSKMTSKNGSFEIGYGIFLFVKKKISMIKKFWVFKNTDKIEKNFQYKSSLTRAN